MFYHFILCIFHDFSQQNHFFGNGHSVCLSMLLPIKIHGISPYLEKQRGLLLFGLQPPPFTFNVFFEQVLKWNEMESILYYKVWMHNLVLAAYCIELL